MTSHDDDDDEPLTIFQPPGGGPVVQLPPGVLSDDLAVVGGGIDPQIVADLVANRGDYPELEIIGGGLPLESVLDVIEAGQQQQSGGSLSDAISSGHHMQPTPTPTEQRVYLTNKATGHVLTMFSSFGRLFIAAGQLVGAEQQKWIVEQSDYGTVRLRNIQHNAMLDSNVDGKVYGLGSNDGGYQKWLATVEPDGAQTLINYSTQKALDSNGEGRVYTMRPNDGAFQRWRLSDA